jgi:hypothetical protein
MEDEKPEIMHPLSPEPKSPLGGPISTPPNPEGRKEPDEYKKGFEKGYKAGYADGKGGKEPTF